MKESKTNKKEIEKKETKKKTTKKVTKDIDETKKKVTKKVREKKKVIKLEEEPIIVEEKTEDANIENPTVILDEQPIIDTKHDYSKIVIAILAILFIGLLLFTIINTRKTYNTYKLSLLCQECFEENDSITLPDSYKLCEDGTIFIEEDNLLRFKGGIYAGQMDSEAFDAQVEEIKTQFEEADEYELNGFRVISFNQQYTEDIKYNYNFIYKDSSLIELVIINPAEDEIKQIINSIKY